MSSKIASLFGKSVTEKVPAFAFPTLFVCYVLRRSYGKVHGKGRRPRFDKPNHKCYIVALNKRIQEEESRVKQICSGSSNVTLKINFCPGANAALKSRQVL